MNLPHDGWDPVMHGDNCGAVAHGLWSQLDAVVVVGPGVLGASRQSVFDALLTGVCAWASVVHRALERRTGTRL